MMWMAIAEHPHNVWLILGGLLLALEMLGASGFLLWSGIAALLVGLVPIGWEWQGATFAVLTGSAWLWWYRLRASDRGRPVSVLNQRGQQPSSCARAYPSPLATVSAACAWATAPGASRPAKICRR